MSPRITSGVTRSDNHNAISSRRQPQIRLAPVATQSFVAARVPQAITPRRRGQTHHPKAHLPDIIKRGPINNQRNNTKKVVGLSLQRKDEPRFIRAKRGSLEATTKTHRNTKARNAILRGRDHLEVPKYKKPAGHVRIPTYRMPNRQGSVQPK